MTYVKIDNDRCSKCGLCVAVCPHKLISEDDADIVVAEHGCMACGHCQAVCPAGAIEVEGLTDKLGFQNLAELRDAIVPGQYDCSELVRLMRSRRSCRQYLRKKVPLSVLEDLVKVGTTAPSGTNSQSWNFILLPERTDVETLGAQTAEFYRRLNVQAANSFYRLLAYVFAGDALGRYYRKYYPSVKEALREWDEERRDRLFHGATAAILVTGRRDASCPGEDAMLATQNILLAAHALGFGTCLIGFVVEAMRRSAILRQAMAIPATEEIYSVIAIGYPGVQFMRVAGRRPVQPRVLHLV